MNVATDGAPPRRDSETFERRCIERALRDRERYRYVHPRLQYEDSGWRVRSPCCSRRVDAEGGEIDIARLQPVDVRRWRLYAREHALASWRLVQEGALGELLQRLRLDPLREFWP